MEHVEDYAGSERAGGMALMGRDIQNLDPGSFRLDRTGDTFCVGQLFTGACLMTSAQPSSPVSTPTSIFSFHGVRYLVTDVQRAVTFYTTHLGFTLEYQQLPAFATVALGPLKLHLSGPAASG